MHVLTAECVRVLVQSELDARDPDAGVDEHQLLFTPPYESEAQMIEKVWAKAKGFVASVDQADRTPTQMRADVIEGFYGGSRFGGVTAADCKSYIKHAIGTANVWLSDSRELGRFFAPCVAPGEMTVQTLTDRMRQQFRDAHPAPAVPRTAHSDSSATDDSNSDSDYA